MFRFLPLFEVFFRLYLPEAERLEKQVDW